MQFNTSHAVNCRFQKIAPVDIAGSGDVVAKVSFYLPQTGDQERAHTGSRVKEAQERFGA